MSNLVRSTCNVCSGRRNGNMGDVLSRGRMGRCRRGASTIDYVLILAVIVPLVGFLFTIVPRMIQLVYEMTVVMIGTPLM